MRRFNKLLRAVQSLTVPRVRPSILRVFAHDRGAYTQGLVFYEGRMFESTGGDHTSSLREVDPLDGRVLRRVSVERDFAEGVCVHERSLYQLTWRSGRVLRYDIDSFAVTGEHRIDHEGWGLASLSGALLVSDGSSLLRAYDNDMRQLSRQSVTTWGLPIRHLNALGAANGRVYANLWYSHWIVEIDPDTARLLRMIDCTELLAIESPRNEHHVLNGIAHDAARGTFYLTGKHWAHCFEVTIPA